MRKPSLAFLGLLVALAAVLLAQKDGVSQTTNQSRTNPVAAGAKGKITVGVFFGDRKAMDIEEIRVAAKEALKLKGYDVADSLHCIVNVVVQGKRPGCAVMFEDHQKDWIYVVNLNARGEVSNVFAGPDHEGVPPKGAPPPRLPDGGVKVKP